MIRNVVFLVLLSTIFIVGLTYLVAPKPQDINAKKEVQLHVKYLPAQYKIVGDEKIYTKAEIFNKEENYIIVGNHESLAVLNDLYTYVKTDKNILVVANISSLPMVLKKFAIEPTLEKFMENKKVKMILDNGGEIIASLNYRDLNPLNYNLYKISKDGKISKLYTGKVKIGALDGLMTDEEKEKALNPIKQYLK